MLTPSFLSQSAADSSLIRGSSALLVDGADGGVGGDAGISPSHWSLVNGEVGDSLGGCGHVEGIGDGFAGSYLGDARIYSFAVHRFLSDAGHRGTECV